MCSYIVSCRMERRNEHCFWEEHTKYDRLEVKENDTTKFRKWKLRRKVVLWHSGCCWMDQNQGSQSVSMGVCVCSIDTVYGVFLNNGCYLCFLCSLNTHPSHWTLVHSFHKSTQKTLLSYRINLSCRFAVPHSDWLSEQTCSCQHHKILIKGQMQPTINPLTLSSLTFIIIYIQALITNHFDENLETMSFTFVWLIIADNPYFLTKSV